MARALTFVWVLALAAMTMATGCDEVRSSRLASASEKAAALDLVAQLHAMTAAPVEPRDIVQAASFAPVITLAAPASAAVTVPDVPIATETPDSCVITAESSVTYSQCELGHHVIDGTWWSRHTAIRTELVDVFVVGPGVHGSITVEANLAAAGEMNGFISTDIMWSTGSGDHVLDATLRVDGLLIEGPRCATGGSVTLTGSFADAPATTTTLWFGPGCRDVQIAAQP